MDTEHWLAILRIGVGLWWLESFRHKDKRAWIDRGAGISWAAGVAAKHRWPAVRRSFDAVVGSRARLMTFVVLGAELAIGVGLVAGLLTPLAAAGGLLLNALYFVLMIHDWAEQGQNSMMALAQLVVIATHAGDTWSLDAALNLNLF